MKKIGIFTGFYLPHLGGVERYVEKISEQLVNKRYKVVIITTRHDNSLNLVEKKANITIYRLPTISLFKSRYPIFNKNNEYKNIIKKIEDEKIDFYVLNTRFHLTSLLGAKIAKNNKKRSILIEHGSNHFTVNNKLLDYFGAKYEHFLTNKLKKYVKYYYGVSERCNKWLEHFNINASGVLYNSIDEQVYKKYKTDKYKYKKDNKLLISFAGRLIKEKGIYLLINAFEKLQKKYSNINLVVAGDGSEYNNLINNKNPNIIYTGKLNYDEVMSLYNETDIFVHPSMFPEGLPTAILEAGIMKCSIIATDRGGTIEVINNEKLGIIIEENEESLYNALEFLINNTNRISDSKENIHNRILKAFTWEKTANDLISIIEKRNKNEKD